jgi:alpha-D-xyloside xylohydrolase
VEAMTESFHLQQDEHLFGLGEKFTPLDKTRQRIVCWTMDAFGSASERSHKNIPLLVSTRGYGLFLNTGRRSTWDLGTESCQSYTLAVDGPYLDAYLIYGPTPAKVLERYTHLTGRAPLPPRWSFGVWLSGGGSDGSTDDAGDGRSGGEHDLRAT